jgi:hypothetical protein
MFHCKEIRSQGGHIRPSSIHCFLPLENCKRALQACAFSAFVTVYAEALQADLSSKEFYGIAL